MKIKTQLMQLNHLQEIEKADDIVEKKKNTDPDPIKDVTNR